MFIFKDCLINFITTISDTIECKTITKSNENKTSKTESKMLANKINNDKASTTDAIFIISMTDSFL